MKKNYEPEIDKNGCIIIRCKKCNKRISYEDEDHFNGLCWDCAENEEIL